MRFDYTLNKPAMLMLSNHFPDPDGCGRAARAWHLLDCASATHEVYLSAVSDKPVNLRLWRRVARRARRVHIAASSWPWVKAKSFSGEVITWTEQQQFKALLATSPDAWPAIYPGNIETAFCDLASDIEHIPSHRGQQPRRFGSLLGLFWQRETSRTRTTQILPVCDHLLVASDQQAQVLRGHRSKTITLPNVSAMDTWTRMFAEATSATPSVPTLAVLAVKPIQVRQAA